MEVVGFVEVVVVWPRHTLIGLVRTSERGEKGWGWEVVGMGLG